MEEVQKTGSVFNLKTNDETNFKALNIASIRVVLETSFKGKVQPNSDNFCHWMTSMFAYGLPSGLNHLTDKDLQILACRRLGHNQ